MMENCDVIEFACDFNVQPAPWLIPESETDIILDGEYDIWPVGEILPAGVCLLGGSPKNGKTFLGLNIIAAITTSKCALGMFETNPGVGLYLGLRDSQRRVRDRLVTILGDDEMPEKLFLADMWEKDTGRESGKLCHFIDDSPEEVRVVVIDALRDLKFSSCQGDLDKLSAIGDIFKDLNSTALVICDTGNTPCIGPLGAFSAMPDLAACADTIWSLENRDTDTLDSILHIQGRDLVQRHIPLKCYSGRFMVEV